MSTTNPHLVPQDAWIISMFSYVFFFTGLTYDVRRHLPLLIVLFLISCTGVLLVVRMMDAAGGVLTYTLDDAYIHLAAASNLAEHGVFGVTRHAFSSSTSSPLFTLLITALAWLFGRSDVYPLLLGAFVVPGMLMVYHRLLLSYEIDAWSRVLLLLLFTHMSGLLWIIFTGLEHVLHLFILILLLAYWQRLHARREGVDVLLMLIAATAVGVRYESLFIVAGVSVLYLVHRRPWSALLLSLAALLPLVVYGIVSLTNGGLFLPNSLIMKGIVHQGDDLSGVLYFVGYRAVSLLGLRMEYYLLPMLLVPAFLLSPLRSDRRMQVVPVLLIAYVLHMMFLNERGAWVRYIAYLIALFTAYGGILAHGVVRDYPTAWIGRTRMFVRVGLVLFFGMLLLPVHFAWKQRVLDGPAMSKNIHDQQVQMAMFVQECLPDSTGIAVTDVGAVSYYTDAPILDLYAVGDDEVAKVWYRGAFSTAGMTRLFQERRTGLVMTYASWLKGETRLPKGVVPIGSWTIANNLACGHATVSMWATDSAAYRKIAPQFRSFSERSLPSDVVVTFGSVEE